MKYYILVIILSLYFSCLSHKNLTDSIEGSFICKGKDFDDKIQLNSNKTFNILFKYVGVIKQCDGTWIIINNNIVLKCCPTTDSLNVLRSDYLGDTTISLKILDKNKIMMGSIILRRTE